MSLPARFRKLPHYDGILGWRTTAGPGECHALPRSLNAAARQDYKDLCRYLGLWFQTDGDAEEKHLVLRVPPRVARVAGYAVPAALPIDAARAQIGALLDHVLGAGSRESCALRMLVANPARIPREALELSGAPAPATGAAAEVAGARSPQGGSVASEAAAAVAAAELAGARSPRGSSADAGAAAAAPAAAKAAETPADAWAVVDGWSEERLQQAVRAAYAAVAPETAATKIDDAIAKYAGSLGNVLRAMGKKFNLTAEQVVAGDGGV